MIVKPVRGTVCFKFNLDKYQKILLIYIGTKKIKVVKTVRMIL